MPSSVISELTTIKIKADFIYLLSSGRSLGRVASADKQFNCTSLTGSEEFLHLPLWTS